jgi:hypothetical protein
MKTTSVFLVLMQDARKAHSLQSNMNKCIARLSIHISLCRNIYPVFICKFFSLSLFYSQMKLSESSHLNAISDPLKMIKIHTRYYECAPL